MPALRQLALPLLAFALVTSNAFVMNKAAEEEDSNQLKFYYFSSPNVSTEIIFNDTDSLQASGLKPATKTFIVMDGFTSNATNSIMSKQLKDSFSIASDNNVIVLDWGHYNGNKFPRKHFLDLLFAYISAMNVIPEVGVHLANFLHFIRLHKQIEFSQITLLSHSLGCNAAGSTGRAVNRIYGSSIGRIVGLDPALQYSASEAPVRLQVGDASVVEIYHTSRQSTGDPAPATGHVTIYPNGGDNQPCEEGEEGPIGSENCSNHPYSWKLYNYLQTNDTIKACPCNGAACLCKGCSFECGDKAIRIGPHIPENARGSYHVTTGYLDWS